MENNMTTEEFEALSDGMSEILKTTEYVFEQVNNIMSNTMSVIGFGLSVWGLFDKSTEKSLKGLGDSIENCFDDIKSELDSFSNKIKYVESKLKNIIDEKEFEKIGKTIAHGLNEGIVKNFDKVEKTMKEMNEKLVKISEKVLDINSPSKVFIRIGEYVTEGLVDGIKEGSDDVTDTMKGLGDDMESSFGEKALSFGGGFALAAGVLGTIVEMFLNLMSTNEEFGAAVDEVWTQITEAFAPVTEAVMNLITSLGEEGMGGSFSWFSDALTGVSELAVSVIGTIGEFWAEHGEAIMLSVGEIWEFVSEILGGAIDFVGGVFEVISGIFSGNAEDIESGMAKLWEGIQDIFSPVVGFFTGIWEKIKESFGTIGQTVADSIGGAFKGTVNAIIRFAENTINGFIRSINKAIRLINEIPGVNVSLLSTISGHSLLFFFRSISRLILLIVSFTKEIVMSIIPMLTTMYITRKKIYTGPSWGILM